MYNLETNDKSKALTVNSTKGKALKIVGDSKHFSPANKEWKNSTYAYNKNSIKSISVLDKMAGKMIKGYFNLGNSKKIARSKRMRTLIRRSTIKRLFVSKPEIKQTADKVMITVYTFDREKQFYIRKLYFYNKSLNLYNLWLNKTLSLVSLSGNRLGARKGNLALSGGSAVKMSKRTLNPLYTNSLVSKKSNLTSRNIRNKTYIHKHLLSGASLSLINHPFLSVLRKRQKIQKRSSVLNVFQEKTLNKIRKNYFSKLFAKKLGLGLKKNRLSYKHFTALKRNKYAKRISKARLFKQNANLTNNSRKQVGTKIRIPYYNLKFKNEMKFFFFKLAYVKKFDYLRKLFFFSFMKYALSLFQTKVSITTTSAKNMRNNELVLKFTVNNQDTKNNLSGQNQVPVYYKLVKNYSNNKLKLIQRINMELLQFLDLTLVNNTNVNANRQKIYSLYEYFKANYFLLFLRKSLKKELLALNYYTKYIINQYKFGKFLPGLKLLVSKIYSKKVELNLVNLKYSHLNSDIYTDTIVSKLKKKVGLLKVLRRSLNLARTPYKFFSVNNAANLNNLHSLDIFKSLAVKPLNIKQSRVLDDNKDISQAGNIMTNDKLDVILNKLYPNSLAPNFNLKSFITLASENSLNKADTLDNVSAMSTDTLNQRKVGMAAKNIKILNQIRYKWVTGVRLEAAGRLTRRFTASRSVFKFRYKGNLKNIDYSLKTDVSKNNISTIMLRNSVQPNLQYSFAKSKRRIGAFGIKGWINSY
jgi:ribosomal protein S3